MNTFSGLSAWIRLYHHLSISWYIRWERWKTCSRWGYPMLYFNFKYL